MESRKLTYLFLIVVVILSSCVKKEPPTSSPSNSEEPNLSISPSSMDVEAAKGTQTFNISNTGSGTLDWEVNTPDVDWLDVSPTSGTNDREITVSFDKNITGKIRTYSIEVSSNAGESSVSLSQDYGAKIDVNQNKIDVTHQTGAVEISIDNVGSKELEWSYDITGYKGGWMEIDQNVQLSSNDDYSFKGSGTITINYDQNYSDSNRNVAIDIRSTGGNLEIPFTQSAIGEWNKVTDAASWSERSGHIAATYNDKLWLFAGKDESDAWYSSDGESWYQATTGLPWTENLWPFEHGYHALIFNQKIWVIYSNGSSTGSIDNQIWKSSDGENWEKVSENLPWGRRPHFSAVVFKNKIWIIGDDNSDVWSSSDGINWKQVSSNNKWSSRGSHSTVALDGKIWLIGGNSAESGNGLSDIWYSKDGENWFEAVSDSPMGGGNTSIVYDNKIWVFNWDKVVYSSDGIEWHTLTENAPYGDVNLFPVVIKENKLWVLGAKENDVWTFETY